MAYELEVFYHYVKDDNLNTSSFEKKEDLEDYPLSNTEDNYDLKTSIWSSDSGTYWPFTSEELEKLIKELNENGELKTHFFEGVYFNKKIKENQIYSLVEDNRIDLNLSKIDFINYYSYFFDGEKTRWFIHLFVKLISKTKTTYLYGPENKFSIVKFTPNGSELTHPSISQKYIWKDSPDSDIKIYEFSEWASSDTEENTYIAKYNDPIIYDSSKSKYTIRGIDVFENAEPYYFGSGTPHTNYFSPIGEDNDKTTTNDIKIQMPDNSIYTVAKTFNSFTIDNYSLTYIKQGTFPKLEENFPLITHNSNKSISEDSLVISVNYADIYEGMLDFSKLGETNKKIKVPASVKIISPGAEELDLSDRLKIHSCNLNMLPTRLGIVVVGGGGGAGGYDITKCECECGDDTDAIIPGGAGGGGEITIGVLNLDYPEINIGKDKAILVSNNNLYQVDSEKLTLTLDNLGWFEETSNSDISKYSEYIATINNHISITLKFIVRGGKGGSSNGENSATRGAKTPKDGANGAATKVYSKIEVETDDGSVYSTKERLVLVANGGSGGKKGELDKNEILGGAGGFGGQKDNVSKDTNYINGHCYFINSFAGGNGGSFTISENEGKAQPMDAYEKIIYFSSNEPTDTYKKRISHEALSLDQVGTANKDSMTWTLRGGWSWGDGGWTNAPTQGGGGSSIKQTSVNDANYIEDKKDTNEPTNGACGWIGLYY